MVTTTGMVLVCPALSDTDRLQLPAVVPAVTVKVAELPGVDVAGPMLAMPVHVV